MDQYPVIGLLRLVMLKPWVTIRLLTINRVCRFLKLIITQSGNLGQVYRKYRGIYLVNEKLAVQPKTIPSSKGDILIFPVIDWNYRFQRPQHLSLQLAKIGYRVFYMATNPLITVSAGRVLVQESPSENVYIIQLYSSGNHYPDFNCGSFGNDEITEMEYSIEELFQRFNLTNPLAFVQHPFWIDLVKGVKWRKLIYDCIDYHIGFLDKPNPQLLENEKKLVKRADFITVSSRGLQAYISKYKDSVLVRNACEYQRFSEVLRRKSANITLGYIGAISTWFDVDLLLTVAELRPDWGFVLIGSTEGASVAKLKRLHNVEMLGELEYSQVSIHLATFDVCLIPFKINSLTKATDPVKIYEYLASGRPVVSTDLPELRYIRGLDIFIATTAVEFVCQIEQALKIADLPDRVFQRRLWARNNDWSTRAESINKLLSA